MSIKIFSLVGDNCCVQRDGDKLVCYPRDSMQGLKLSDNRMRELFYLYASYLESERLEERMRNRNDN